MADRLKILFLCTGNSCRSQMAEGFANHLRGEDFQAFSAGIQTHGLNPHAVTVMKEAGVDISGHYSKHVDEFKGMTFDAVITVCDHARETCPWFPGRVIHAGFDDPPALAREKKTPEEQLDCFRRVRDQIRDFILNFHLEENDHGTSF